MKVKKHYNSFHPKLGFFIHLEEVQEWFEAEPSYYLSVSGNAHVRTRRLRGCELTSSLRAFSLHFHGQTSRASR